MNPGDQPPSLYFRFSNFRLNYVSYWQEPAFQFWSGIDPFTGYEWSYNSAMYLTLQDCNFRGGQVSLGNPDYYYYDPSTVWGSGAVTWLNNSFDRVAVNLDPTYYEYGYGMNVDLALSAYNNLFRGGEWFHLEPIPATAGNWVLNDNLFDKADIVQDTASPLNFSNNGYWPLSTNGLTWDSYFYPWPWIPNSAELQPTPTSDGSHEVTLSGPPPYETGLFGDFYLPDNTPLYGAGSTNAAGVGLYHYTTRLDQVKEGNEPAGHMVNIGVHYAAANANNLPVDTDGDGIPDYLEDANGNGIYDPATESDWRTPETNGVYFIGLTNGMVLSGIVSLPVEMYEVSTDQIAGTTIYGSGQPLVGAAAQNNYTPWLNWQMNWNTLMVTNGTYTISPEADFVTDDPTPGSTISVTVSNAISFPNYFTCFFGDQMWIYAQTTTPDANYEIDMYDESGNYLGAFTGSADDNGAISFIWDLTDGNGNTYTDTTFYGVFTVTSASPSVKYGVHPDAGGSSSSSSATQVWTKEPSWTVGNSWAIAYSPLNVNDSGGSTLSISEMMIGGDGGEYGGVVSTLGFYGLGAPMSPGNVSQSSAFEMADANSRAQFLGYLAQSQYRHFYFFGHGSPSAFGTQGAVITSDDITRTLLNVPLSWQIQHVAEHPYRFVFIDGCQAGAGNLCESFGIPAITVNTNFFGLAGVESRAFLGFKKTVSFDPSQWTWRALMLGGFFDDWMTPGGMQLRTCVGNAEAGAHSGGFQPMDSSAVIYGAVDLTKDTHTGQ